MRIYKIRLDLHYQCDRNFKINYELISIKRRFSRTHRESSNLGK